MLQSLITKISSRKFLACIAGFILGISMMFNLDQGTVSAVAGAVVSLGSLATYILAEGKIDAERIKNTIDSVTNAVDAVKENEDK